jgi:nucleotide sugar dehydrogenase
MAKIMENSYRAVNIAFIEEWARFSEKIGTNSFEIINAIRKRPTHSNIRQPGFGVGGYCLTKDPYFASLSARQIFNIKSLDFPFSELGVRTNDKMPIENIKMLKKVIKTFKNKNILLLGATYRSEVDDVRSSPSEIFVSKILKLGAKVDIHDPYVKKWDIFKINILNTMPVINKYDAVVLAVSHKFYKNFKFIEWIGKKGVIFMDANNILPEKVYYKIINNGNKVIVTGRGDL